MVNYLVMNVIKRLPQFNQVVNLICNFTYANCSHCQVTVCLCGFSAVVILCMGADKIRQIMLAAHSRKLTNGSHMFFNVELFNASSYGKLTSLCFTNHSNITNITGLLPISSVLLSLSAVKRYTFLFSGLHSDKSQDK